MEKINLKDLQEKLPYQWRVQSFSEYACECSCVAYIDSRDVQHLLDKVVWPENWQDEYYQVKNTMLCKIWIKIDWEWVWKWDGGTETDIESEKGELSDSFKRAAVKWGIGRFLYDLKIEKVETNEKLIKENNRAKNRPYPVHAWKRIYDLTKHINSQWNNAPIRDDVPQVPSKTAKPYITSPIITMKIQDVKEGKIQVSSADSLIELLRRDYKVASDWAEKEIRAKYDTVDKSKQI